MTRGSLIGEIWLFVICILILLPAIWLDKYIGLWSLLAAAGFWVIVGSALVVYNKHRGNRV